jgi:hypothetical protein
MRDSQAATRGETLLFQSRTKGQALVTLAHNDSSVLRTMQLTHAHNCGAQFMTT